MQGFPLVVALITGMIYVDENKENKDEERKEQGNYSYVQQYPTRDTLNVHLVGVLQEEKRLSLRNVQNSFMTS